MVEGLRKAIRNEKCSDGHHQILQHIQEMDLKISKVIRQQRNDRMSSSVPCTPILLRFNHNNGKLKKLECLKDSSVNLLFFPPPFQFVWIWLQDFTLEFFALESADGFPLEFERQHVSSLQDSSQYSGWSQQWCSLDDLYSSSYFQVFRSLYQSFGDCTECINYNWYRHLLCSIIRPPVLLQGLGTHLSFSLYFCNIIISLYHF